MVIWNRAGLQLFIGYMKITVLLFVSIFWLPNAFAIGAANLRLGAPKRIFSLNVEHGETVNPGVRKLLFWLQRNTSSHGLQYTPKLTLEFSIMAGSTIISRDAIEIDIPELKFEQEMSRIAENDRVAGVVSFNDIACGYAPWFHKIPPAARIELLNRGDCGVYTTVTPDRSNPERQQIDFWLTNTHDYISGLSIPQRALPEGFAFEHLVETRRIKLVDSKFTPWSNDTTPELLAKQVSKIQESLRTIDPYLQHQIGIVATMVRKFRVLNKNWTRSVKGLSLDLSYISRTTFLLERMKESLDYQKRIIEKALRPDSVFNRLLFAIGPEAPPMDPRSIHDLKAEAYYLVKAIQIDTQNPMTALDHREQNPWLLSLFLDESMTLYDFEFAMDGSGRNWEPLTFGEASFLYPISILMGVFQKQILRHRFYVVPLTNNESNQSHLYDIRSLLRHEMIESYKRDDY
jgi:hypothetical protein